MRRNFVTPRFVSQYTHMARDFIRNSHLPCLYFLHLTQHVQEQSAIKWTFPCNYFHMCTKALLYVPRRHIGLAYHSELCKSIQYVVQFIYSLTLDYIFIFKTFFFLFSNGLLLL